MNIQKLSRMFSLGIEVLLASVAGYGGFLYSSYMSGGVVLLSVTGGIVAFVAVMVLYRILYPNV